MDERTRNSRVIRIVAALLCLLIIGATLDTVPDPPAVTQRVQHALISQAKQHAQPAPIVAASVCLICVSYVEAKSFFAGQALEATYRARKIASVPQAADSSPPSFS
jgi:hypothetical protein